MIHYLFSFFSGQKILRAPYLINARGVFILIYHVNVIKFKVWVIWI